MSYAIYRRGFAVASASVMSIAAFVAVTGKAHAQQPQASSKSIPIPPVVVEQAKPKPIIAPAANKAVPKTVTTQSTPPAKAKPQASPVAANKPAPLPPAEPTLDASSDGTQSATTGVGTTGLAVPLSSFSVGNEALAAQRVVTSDTASLLKNAPGVSIYQTGGVAGLPVINGLADDRINILVSGMPITSACANHMNPALSYTDPANVGSIEVISGAAPVSKGGDNIAGTIIVEPKATQFATGTQGVRRSASLSTFYRSNSQAFGGSVSAEAATQNFSMRYDGATVSAGNYHQGNGGPEVKSTEYEARNHAVTLTGKLGDGDLLTVQAGLQHIPSQGFVNQRMDMVDNSAQFANVRYQGHFGWGLLDARAYFQHTSHEMNFLDDKKYNKVAPYRDMPMLTEGRDAGYALKAEIPISGTDLVRLGNELQHQGLNDWWTPTTAGVSMMGPNNYITLNDATRDRVGTFIEWEKKWSSAWTTLLGARHDIVWMDTGNVQGYNNVVGGMAGVYAVDAAAFNAREHARTDSNFGMSAMARYEPTSNSAIEASYAMKSRAPNLYERYTWSKVDSTADNAQMAMNMFGWFGDGNGYTGNLDLKSETAHTASVTLALHDGASKNWGLKVTPYYTYVNDYIGVRRLPYTNAGVLGGSIGHPGFVNLQFVNHDAELYGANVSGAMPLFSQSTFGRFALTGGLNYVHGENADTGVSLYHMMPLHGRLALTHKLGNWTNAVEFEAVGGKNNVDTVRNELTTSAYTQVNLHSSYELGRFRFDAGVTNLFDTYYENPMGGHYIEPTMPGHIGGVTAKGNVPGMGRSFNTGITVKF
ncbi:MAG: TonB-dependent receptor [Hyphomicrobiaceae bacterium]